MTGKEARPTVSVCVATYDQRDMIADCLLSVVMQRHDADIEILVGDDGSTDGTSEIVETIAGAYPDLIRVIRHAPNVGAARNYQHLVGQARGRYIAHLDGDDFWLPGKVKAQVEFLAQHPECVAIYSNAVAIDGAGRVLGAFNNDQPTTVDLGYVLRRGNYLNLSSLLYRATLKHLITGIAGEFIDYRIHLRLAMRGRLGFINRALVAYRVGSATSMIARAPDRVRELYWQALKDCDACAAVRSSLIDARACFWAEVVHASLDRRGLSPAWKWASRIRRELPRDAAKILVRGSAYGVRLLHVRVKNKFLSIIGRTNLRILHRR